MRKFIRLFLAIVLLAGFVLPVQAEDISFTAEVDTHTVQAGSPVLLMLAVKGPQAVEPIELPEIRGFKPRYLGPRQQLAIVNGKTDSSISFMYNLYAMEVGHFQIPAISVTINNKIYTTEPIEIEVVDQATTNSPTENQATVNDKVFLVLSVPTKEYFVGERLPLTIKLYVSESEQVNLASNIDFKREGFDIGEIVDSRRYRQMLGGENYDVVEFTTHVYPRRTGELTLGPAQLLCRILARDSQRRSSFDLPSVFDDDFFSGFFNNEWRDLMVTSADISLKVLPLPEEGKPADFSGAVGQFDFEAWLSPAEVKVGDPLTLRMKISGNGTLQNINFPPPAAGSGGTPQFKFYEPQVREDKTEKTLEQVVIPTTDRVKEFPTLRFSYFNTEKRKYETIVKGPFPIKVLAADQPAAPKVVGGGQMPGLPPAKMEEERVGQGISFIKDYPGTLRPVGFYLYKSPGFLTLVVIVILFWLGAFAFYSFRYKLKTDAAFATRFLAPRKARRELNEARHSLDKGNQKEFYDRLFKTLQSYLGSKLAAKRGDTMEELLKRQGANPQIVADLREFLSEGEMVRFASMSVSKENMEKSFVRVQRIIDYLERHR
jgi:hypothetical protein